MDKRILTVILGILAVILDAMKVQLRNVKR